MNRISSFSRFLLFLMAAVILLLPLTAASASSGDLNGDGLFDNQDLEDFRAWLVNEDVWIQEELADLDGDGRIAASDLVLLKSYLAQGITPEDGVITVSQVVYGQSTNGRDLVCTVIEPERYNRTVLAVFGIHGFEGLYDRDGQALADAADALIDHYAEAVTMHYCRLLVVSCANPDGLLDGTSADGFGRCNAKGIDIEMDFDAAYVRRKMGTRNYTPFVFSSNESKALRDLYNQYAPDIVLDFHGWSGQSLGDAPLADIFTDEMGIFHDANFSDKYHGWFTNWTHKQGAASLRVEFPEGEVPTETFFSAMDRIVTDTDLTSTGRYDKDPRFDTFDEIVSFAYDWTNVNTFTEISGTKTGYISGRNDLCVIEEVYRNGWVRVRYPIKEGEKIGYCPLSGFIDSETVGMPISLTMPAKKFTPVYSRSSLSYKLESIKPEGTVYLMGYTDTAASIIYPRDDGTWRLGWLALSDVPNETLELLSLGLPEKEETVTERAQTPKFSAACYTTMAEDGQTFDLLVVLSGDDLAALRLWLEWDENSMELIDVRNGDRMANMTNLQNLSSNPYCILWEEPINPNSEDLVHLTFRVREGAEAAETTVRIYTKPANAVGLTADI